jgi:hypothetical protein
MDVIHELNKVQDSIDNTRLQVSRKISALEDEIVDLKVKIKAEKKEQEIPFVVGGEYIITKHNPERHFLIKIGYGKYQLKSVNLSDGVNDYDGVFCKKEVEAYFLKYKVEYTGKTLLNLLEGDSL